MSKPYQKKSGAPKKRAKAHKANGAFTVKWPDYQRPRQNTKRAKPLPVMLVWPKGTRPMSAKTLKATLIALREMPDRTNDIHQALYSTIKPGVTYYKDQLL